MKWLHWAVQWRNRNNPVGQAMGSSLAGTGKQAFKNVLDEKSKKDKIAATFSFLKSNTLKQEDSPQKTEEKINVRKKKV